MMRFRTIRVHDLREKLAILRDRVMQDAQTPAAILLARAAVSRVDRAAPRSANILAVGRFVKGWIRYAKEPHETFTSLKRLRELPVGDCDDMAAAVAILLEALRYRWRFVIGTRKGNPVHVWVQAWAPEVRRWIDVDPSASRVPIGRDPREGARL